MASRVAKNPIALPTGVEVKITGQQIIIKGKQGELSRALHPYVKAQVENNAIRILIAQADEPNADALAGTTRALVNNMVQGVYEGFKRKLLLVGVGYRAKVEGKLLNLSLGFSHPVNVTIPQGITIETPSQTEIIVKGADKEVVTQIAANIRAIRPVEPYKGKGVRYENETVILKEAKKK